MGASPSGLADDLPVAGDWDGSGHASIGMFRPSDGSWVLDDGNGIFDGCSVDACFVFGAPGIGRSPAIGDRSRATWQTSLPLIRGVTTCIESSTPFIASSVAFASCGRYAD